MATVDLIKKLRKIEIKSKGLSNQLFSGEYHSAFKGRGMAFSEVREYQPGDDIRTIDWNVTARFNHPFIKVYEEEREMTVMLVVDVSGSENFGTEVQLKKDLITNPNFYIEELEQSIIKIIKKILTEKYDDSILNSDINKVSNANTR